MWVDWGIGFSRPSHPSGEGSGFVRRPHLPTQGHPARGPVQAGVPGRLEATGRRRRSPAGEGTQLRMQAAERAGAGPGSWPRPSAAQSDGDTCGGRPEPFFPPGSPGLGAAPGSLRAPDVPVNLVVNY